ncbi:MAG: FHA domain-containing protein [Spirulina sp. SIO3F2]|nr:FHA domain-containing protein [Spirulina sp. SIO3F2]
MDLENKLNLYQIFQQLYTAHPELLADLLHLENAEVDELPQAIAQHRYIMGVIEDDAVYLMTNLLAGRTHKLYQPQGIWTMGRGQDNALTIIDEHLSRHHAAIQYIATQGFFIHDLQSTNGTFINQEPVTVPLQLREGDRLRVGGIVFSFFCCQSKQAAPLLSDDLVSYFSQSTPTRLPEPSDRTAPLLNPNRKRLQQRKTAILGQESAEEQPPAQPLEIITLTSEEQAKVLDRFFQRDEEDD